MFVDSDYNYWLFFGGFLIVLLAVSFFVYRYLYRFLFWAVRKTPNQLDDRIVEATHKTLPVFIFFSGVYQLLQTNPYLVDVQDNLVGMYQSFLIVVLFWTLNRFIHTYEKHGGLFPFQENLLYAPYMLRLIKVLLLFVAFYLLLENWGYDLSKLLAGVGITGIAFAFAARDTFSNIFSGMVIVIEKPFAVGDQISTEELEGKITDINFRSTTIDTVDKVQVIVPNSKLINNPLTNKTRTEQVKAQFYVVYEKKTIEMAAIKSILQKCYPDGVAVEDTVLVKNEAIYEDCIVYKVSFFSSLPITQLNESIQECMQTVLIKSEEKKLSVYYLGFEKPVMSELKRGNV